MNAKSAQTISKNRGMALVVTLLFLAVLSLMSTTFVINMTTDGKVVSNFYSDVSAQYIAKAGYYHALSVLRADWDFINADPSFEDYDWYNDVTSSASDDWVTMFSGSDVDLADTITRSTGQIGTDKPDARWIYLHAKPTDGNSPIIGRYAVLIQDENARLNINTVGAQYDSIETYQQGESVNEIDLEDLFENIGSVSNSLASSIVSSPLKPYSSIEELYKITGINPAQLNTLSDYLTINSADYEMFYDSMGIPNTYNPRIQMNYENRINVLANDFFYNLFWGDSVKENLAAINLIDYRDDNFVPTVYSETELAQDMNGDSTISSSTLVYGVEGIQINEVLTDAWAPIEVTNTTFITLDSGTFTVGGTYASGTSTDFSTIATAKFEVAWENGVYTVKVYSYAEPQSDDISCRVEGVGFDTVPSGGSKEFAITVNDGSITIELEDPLQVTGGVPSATQIPSKFYKIEIKAGEFIEIANISRQPITLDTSWNIVCNNGTPSDTSDDRIYHLPSNVTLNGASYITTIDPKRISYDYLILTNSEKALDIIFGSTADGIWDGGGTVLIPIDSSGNPTFSILDAGDDDITIMDNSGRLIDVIASTDPNNYSVDGYKKAGGVTTGISREKISPDYDLVISGNAVWQDSSIASSIASYFGSPGSGNSGHNYYVTVKDSAIVNPFFIYDMPKNEFQNDPNGALSITSTYMSYLAKRMGFLSNIVSAENYLRKTNWSLTSSAGNTYLGLISSATSGSNVTWNLDTLASGIDDGEYRLFLEAMEPDEVHAITGRYFDISSNSVQSKEITTTVRKDKTMCINGNYINGEDDLLPFKVTQGLLSVQDNADASTPVTENSMYRIVLQPAGFTPLIQGKININTSDLFTLSSLPGVDSTLAGNIVSYSLSSPFTDISELMYVSGMTFSQYCKIANLVTVRSSGFRIIVLGQAIKDGNHNGTFDSADAILGSKKCVSSVIRTVDKNNAEQPSAITFITRYFYWKE